MDSLKISLAEVLECASRISDGGEAIRAKFNVFATRFETEKETIDSYAAFLDRTAESYDTLETTITSNAQSMQV